MLQAHTTWKASDITLDTQELIHRIPIIEFQDANGEWHEFHIITLPDRVVFGRCCNSGFIESGYILRGANETLHQVLQGLLADLHAFYDHGDECTSSIIHNDRM